MNRLLLVLVSLAVTACAHLPNRQERDAAQLRVQLWNEAHVALYDEAFERADSIFALLSDTFPTNDEGREARFYIGTLHLDPRNPESNSERAETALHRYLLQDTVGGVIHRRPEATTLLAIAREINRAVAAEIPPAANEAEAEPVRAAPSIRELQEDNARLRRELLQRDEQLRRQRDELDRIRRALAPRTP
jgi:hypothetical protein